MNLILGFLLVMAGVAAVAGLFLFFLWAIDQMMPEAYKFRDRSQSNVEVRLTDTPSDLEDEDLTTTINGREYKVRNNIVVDDGSSRSDLPDTPPDLE